VTEYLKLFRQTVMAESGIITRTAERLILPPIRAAPTEPSDRAPPPSDRAPPPSDRAEASEASP
jgi:hypothetical protein